MSLKSLSWNYTFGLYIHYETDKTEVRILSFHSIGILKQYRGHIPARSSGADEIADILKVHRNITDYFGTYINPALLEIYIRVFSEIIVMVVTVNNPAIKYFYVIRIVNQQEPETIIFQQA